jgi:hypothetical protein
MKTYQDLLDVAMNDEDRMAFVRTVIGDHKSSELYRTALIADQYNRHQNVTINAYQKILYTVTGKAVPDNWSANFKMACRHFHRFVTQENQFLLGNGVTWENEDTKDKLGTQDKPFDTQLQNAGRKALVHGVSFGFFNFDHLDVFSVLEFAPLYDEEDGAMKAGVRFWQIAPDKPLRATLYEPDGYTDYIWIKGEGSVLADKRPYKLNYTYTEADGTEIYSGENYPDFPIVPLWGNQEKQSEIVGLREQIDCYDLIKSGFANTVDEASIVYWTLNNAGGMDDVDLAKFVERMKTVHAAVMDDDGATAESHMLEVPYNSREALLERLDKDLYRDAMALDVEQIASGATTATQIKAAYEPLNSKCDDYEYCILEFINRILTIAEIDDKPTFTRSMIVNVTENIQALVQAGQYLDSEYVTRKILGYLGDKDQADEIINRMNEEDMNRFLGADDESSEI